MLRLLAALALLLTCIMATAQVAPLTGWTQHSTPQGEEMTPTAAPNVSILIHPPESLAGSDLATWFSRRANEEMQRAGQSLGQPRITRNSAQAYSMYAQVKDANGQQFVLLYSCVERSDGTAQLIATRIPDGEKDAISYVRTAGTITGQFAKSQTPPTTPQATTEARNPIAPAGPASDSAPQQPTPTSNSMTVTPSCTKAVNRAREPEPCMAPIPFTATRLSCTPPPEPHSSFSSATPSRIATRSISPEPLTATTSPCLRSSFH